MREINMFSQQNMYIKILKNFYTGWCKIFCKCSLFRHLIAPLDTPVPRGADWSMLHECHVTLRTFLDMRR